MKRSYPMNINRTMAAVMRAPLLAGDSIPNMANTEDRRERKARRREGEGEREEGEREGEQGEREIG